MTGATNRPAAAIALIAHFVVSGIASGFETLRIILRPASAVTPGYLVYHFAPLGELAATILASIICLTPGTSVVELEPSEGRMRIHLLDGARGDDTLREIRERLEPLVRTLFASGGRR